MKQDILAYKRDLMAKQRDFPVNPPNPSSGSGGDQLTKHFRQEAKAKMLALHNQVKIFCEGIQSDAQLYGIGTGWDEGEDDDIGKAMRDKDRWITITIQLQSDFSSYEAQVLMVANSQLQSSTSEYGVIIKLVEDTRNFVEVAITKFLV